jgi:glycosidase
MRLTGIDVEKLAKNAAVYPFINDGIPILYMGQEHVNPSKVLSTRSLIDHRG